MLEVLDGILDGIGCYWKVSYMGCLTFLMCCLSLWKYPPNPQSSQYPRSMNQPSQDPRSMSLHDPSPPCHHGPSPSRIVLSAGSCLLVVLLYEPKKSLGDAVEPNPYCHCARQYPRLKSARIHQVAASQPIVASLNATLSETYVSSRSIVPE